jgi:general secretion pathway protein E
LVLATLHTNDAVSAISRLTDMGVEPFLLSSSLLGVLAQRLLRKICQPCSGKGCQSCAQTGYQGRTGIFELVTIDETLRGLIHARAAESQLREAAIKNGLTTLREDGERLIERGISTREELVRVTRD